MKATYRKTGKTIRDWLARWHSRRELAVLGHIGQRDLGCRLDINAEVMKPFWRA